MRSRAVHPNSRVRTTALGGNVETDLRHILVAGSAVERYLGEVQQDGVVSGLRANERLLDLLVALLVIGITSGNVVLLHAS